MSITHEQLQKQGERKPRKTKEGSLLIHQQPINSSFRDLPPAVSRSTINTEIGRSKTQQNQRSKPIVPSVVYWYLLSRLTPDWYFTYYRKKLRKENSGKQNKDAYCATSSLLKYQKKDALQCHQQSIVSSFRDLLLENIRFYVHTMNVSHTLAGASRCGASRLPAEAAASPAPPKIQPRAPGSSTHTGQTAFFCVQDPNPGVVASVRGSYRPGKGLYPRRGVNVKHARLVRFRKDTHSWAG